MLPVHFVLGNVQVIIKKAAFYAYFFQNELYRLETAANFAMQHTVTNIVFGKLFVI